MSGISSTKRTLARVIVRVYPTAWRIRYEADLLSALGARGVTWPDLADLLWCGVAEWSRSEVGRHEGPATLAQRGAIALGASLGVAVLTTGICLLVFLSMVAVVRAWIGSDVLEVFGFIPRSGWPIDLWFGYSLLFSLPAIALCGPTGLGRRQPAIARILTAGSFASFTAWLPIAAMPFLPYVVQLVIAAIAGWVLAIVLFPTRHGARTSEAHPRAAADARDAATRSITSRDRPPRILRAVTP